MAGPKDGKRRWQLGPSQTTAVAVVVGATVLFAGASALRMNMHADYIYHWGQKAARYALLGGVDVAFLSAPWNAYLHPDYPSLLPALHAAGFNASGGLGWPPTATFAVFFFALLAAALVALADAASTGARASGAGRLAAVTVAVLGAVAFAVGFRQAGGADLVMAAAVTAAACALVREPSRRSDLEVAIVAAVLAAVKLEGLPAAALLLALHGLRRAVAAPGQRPGDRFKLAVVATLRSAIPCLVVVGLWAWMTFSQGLFLDSNTGDFQVSRLPAVLAGLGRTLLMPDWWGLPLALLALPLLLVASRERFAALFLLAQFGFYIYSYAAGPVDTVHWIATSAARLLFHLVPAALVLVVLAADRASMRGESTKAGPSASR